MELLVGPGQEHDVLRAEELLGNHRPRQLIADKGYDSDVFVAMTKCNGAEPVIPPRSNRLKPREYDRKAYKTRNLAERFFNRLKHYRRVATRYEKRARNYLAFAQFAATLILLNVNVNTT